MHLSGRHVVDMDNDEDAFNVALVQVRKSSGGASPEAAAARCCNACTQQPEEVELGDERRPRMDDDEFETAEAPEPQQYEKPRRTRKNKAFVRLNDDQRPGLPSWGYRS